MRLKIELQCKKKESNTLLFFYDAAVFLERISRRRHRR